MSDQFIANDGTLECCFVPAQPVVEVPLLELLADVVRSEEHTSELQSRWIISYAVFCLDRKSVV